jgi:hypothetical protein
MKAFHISSANNCVADALSRGQFQKFKELAPEADTFPTAVPMEFWSLLNSTSHKNTDKAIEIIPKKVISFKISV